MPKAARYALVWSSEQDLYALYQQDHRDSALLYGDEDAWFAWLSSHTSFAFQGKSGHLTLLKEGRQRGGAGYWYAYRRQEKRTVKQYAGRSAALTMERLEAVAQNLSAQTGETPVAGDGRLQTERVVPPHYSAPPTEAMPDLLPRVGMRSPGTPEQPLLLVPKLHPPRLPSALVLRERLFVRLDSVLEHKLTILSAPAGFGKTTLVSQWMADRRAAGIVRQSFPPVAWVSLDGGDNDPVRFWRYVLTACQTLHAHLGNASLALLRALYPPWQPAFRQPSLEAALTLLLNELALVPGEGVLVLEDYHAITEPAIHEMLTFVLEHLPARLHLIVLSRVDPPLPLARLRARSELVELQAVDLRFSLEEVAILLHQTVPSMSSPLSDEMSNRLLARTEGWATGLHLLALLLQGRESAQEIEHVLTTFTGGHRHLLEYFVTEVLDRQPEVLQDFLLRTSVLSLLTGSLCDAVTARDDGEYILKAVEHAGLFLQPLGGVEPWYRYHALFAEAMQQEACRRLGEDALRLCLSQASCWYEQHGLLTEAIEAALSAGACARAASLIEQFSQRHSSTAYLHGELHTVRRWLEQLPEADLHAIPSLCFLYANALVFTSPSDHLAPALLRQLERFLHLAEQGWQHLGELSRLGEMLAFRALLAVRQGETAAAALLARQALAQLPEGERFSSSRVMCLGIIGDEARQGGLLNTARKMFGEALALCEAIESRPGRRVITLALGDVYYGRGELRRAEACYRQVSEQAEGDLTDQTKALLGLAQLSYEWNTLEQAEREVQEALELSLLRADESLQIQAQLLQARLLHARGASAQAQSLLQTLLAELQPERLASLQWAAQTLQARLQLADGDLSAVRRWITTKAQDEVVLPLLQQEQESMLVVRWLLAQEQAEEALGLLERLLDAAQETGRFGSVLEIQVLMSLAHHMRKHTGKAGQVLHEAFSRASAEGYLRLFLDEGAMMAALLRTVWPDVRGELPRTYVHRLLLAFAQADTSQTAMPSSAPSPLVEPLSQQEQRVLRLLAAGLSYAEIARELVVSLNTVKTHVKSVYRKLYVTNRKEASAEARRLDLL